MSFKRPTEVSWDRYVYLFMHDAIVEANTVKCIAKNVYHLHQKPLKNLLKNQFIQSLSDKRKWK